MIGGLSFTEILVILVLALLLFGPKRLPQIGRSLGRALGEFRRATSDLKRSFEEEVAMSDPPAHPRRPDAAGDQPETPQLREAPGAVARSEAEPPAEKPSA